MKKLFKIATLTALNLAVLPAYAMQQPPQNWDRWILKVQLPDNPTQQQVIQRKNEVEAIVGNRIYTWFRFGMFNEIWMGIHERRPRIIELLQDEPWFNVNKLTIDAPLPPVEDLRPPRNLDEQEPMTPF